MDDARLISSLGGPTALAKELNRLKPKKKKRFTRSRVSMWKCRDSIPSKHKRAVASIANECGVDLPKGFLDWVQE